MRVTRCQRTSPCHRHRPCPVLPVPSAPGDVLPALTARLPVYCTRRGSGRDSRAACRRGRGRHRPHPRWDHRTGHRPGPARTWRRPRPGRERELARTRVRWSTRGGHSGHCRQRSGRERTADVPVSWTVHTGAYRRLAGSCRSPGTGRTSGARVTSPASGLASRASVRLTDGWMFPGSPACRVRQETGPEPPPHPDVLSARLQLEHPELHRTELSVADLLQLGPCLPRGRVRAVAGYPRCSAARPPDVDGLALPRRRGWRTRSAAWR